MASRAKAGSEAKPRRAAARPADLRAGVRGTTRVVAILGDPVDHSLSPAMHNAAYAALGLDYVYVPLRAPRAKLRDAIRSLRTLGIVGLNVTVPYKEDVARLVDRQSDTARAIGAVNTVYLAGDEIVGDNTDAEGFARASSENSVKIRGARVLVIGAGGSARAVLYALGRGGAAEVVVANRTRSKAARLVRALAPAFPAGSALVASGLDALGDRSLLATRTLVVNSTPVGLKGGEFLAYEVVATPERCAHFDLAYGKTATPFLREAARAGRPTVDGRHMLVYQGAAAFRLFTGKKAPVAAMFAAVGV